MTDKAHLDKISGLLLKEGRIYECIRTRANALNPSASFEEGIQVEARLQFGKLLNRFATNTLPKNQVNLFLEDFLSRNREDLAILMLAEVFSISKTEAQRRVNNFRLEIR